MCNVCKFDDFYFADFSLFYSLDIIINIVINIDIIIIIMVINIISICMLWKREIKIFDGDGI